MNSRVEIDLLNLSDESRQLLTNLLYRKRKDGLKLEKGKVYWVGLRRVSLSHDLVMREKLPGDWHYDVVTNEDCGKGKFGSAHVILGVLRHAGPSLSLSPKSKRVYKKQNNAALSEFGLMSRCPHLQTRTLIPGLPSYISMRKFSGVMLNDALNNERKIKPFTHAQRYRISIALLRALKKQIHDNMICHRDIKPDNIFYNPDNGEIDIFDLGISQLIGDTADMRSRGNATFSAPEEFTSVQTSLPVTMPEFRVSAAMQSMSSVEADIYSMARVIGLVWRDNDPIFFIKDIDHVRLMKRRIHENWQPRFQLFQNIPSVSEEEKNQIEDQLRRMTALDPSQRPSLDSCIAYFDHLFLQYKLSKAPLALQDVIKSAHDLALTVQSKLDEIERRQDLAVRISNTVEELGYSEDMKVTKLMASLNGKLCYEYHVTAAEIHEKYLGFSCDPDLSVREFICYLKTTSSLDAMVSYIKIAFQELSDHPCAVTEFIETLDVKIFYGITSKDDLLKKIDEVSGTFIWHLSTILHLYESMRKNSDAARATDLNYFLTSLIDERITIDNLHRITEHMQRKLIKMTDSQHDAAPRFGRGN